MNDQTVGHQFDRPEEFEEILSAAEAGATSQWQRNFVAGIRKNYSEFKTNMYLSQKQRDMLLQMSEGLNKKDYK